MQSREEVYSKVVDILADLFEMDRAVISPESQLYEELDIDSIDAVDLLVELKTYTGKKVAPEDFKSVRTVADIVDSVCALLEND
ncbi:MAG: acyl carrier protein [Pseudomonadales bacterium]